MIVGVQYRRNPQLLPGVEAGRHDAHDGMRHAIEGYRFAQHIAAGLEMRAPKCLAQDRHLGAGRRFLFGPKAAPELGLNAKRGEEVGGHLLAVDGHGIADACAVPVPAIVGRELLECCRGRPAGDELGIRHGPEAEWSWLLGHGPHRVQLRRLVVRERPQQHRFDDRKDSRVRADTDGQRADRDRGEGGIAPQVAEGIAQILDEAIHRQSSGIV